MTNFILILFLIGIILTLQRISVDIYKSLNKIVIIFFVFPLALFYIPKIKWSV
jgi:hypothetical protein